MIKAKEARKMARGFEATQKKQTLATIKGEIAVISSSIRMAAKEGARTYTTSTRFISYPVDVVRGLEKLGYKVLRNVDGCTISIYW